MSYVAIVVGALLAVVVLSLLLDALLRHQMAASHACSINHLSDSSSFEDDKTLIVFLPGLLANSTALPERLIKLWSQYGEVWGVDYTPPRFQPEEVVRSVTNWLTRLSAMNGGAERVVLIGSSLGGMLVYDIEQQLSKSPVVKARVDLVVVDAPTGRSDLAVPLNITAPLVRAFPLGPIWNHMSGPIMKLLFIPPKEGEIDADVDRDWLAQQVEGARSFPLSFWRDQVMCILTHGAPKRDSIDGDKLVYIRSTGDDDTVKWQAAVVWCAAVPDAQNWAQVNAEGAKHAAYAQNPNAYEEAFPRAFELLGL